MKRILLIPLLACVVFASLPQQADAQFLFPNIRAARANAQSRALVAVGQQQALRFGAPVVVNQVAVVKARPVVVAAPAFAYVPRQSVVYLGAASYAPQVVAAPVYQAQVFAAPVCTACQPAQFVAAPQFSASYSYSAGVVSAGSAYCGF